MRNRLVAATLAVCLAAAGCGPERDPRPRVVLIGVDGVDDRVVTELIAEGKLPNLAAFLERGARGHLATLLPTYSPNVWASVATGERPEEHGITGFAARDESGRLVPFTSNARRSPALWNLLDRAGLRSAVIGWWTTWPAEEINGVVVSDRLLYNRFNLFLGYARFGEELPAQTHPEELFRVLAPETRPPAGLEREFFEWFASGREMELVRDLHDPWYELFLVYARDRAYTRIRERVEAEQRFDLLAWYLNSPDIASHYFWKYRYPEEWGEPLPAEELTRRRDVVAAAYAWTDRALAPLLEQAGPGCIVFVVSDHGFVTGRRGDSPNISGIHYDRAPPGVLYVAGGGIPPGTRVASASVLDIAPTILHRLRVPVPRGLAGDVIPELRRGEVEYGDALPRKPAEAGADPIPTEDDDVILEKLRALGYIR